HVALDLELSGHVGACRVELAGDDALEALRGARDRGVGAGGGAFGDADAAVVDRDRPLPGAVDVEGVGVRHPGGAGRVDPALQALEELAHAFGHGPAAYLDVLVVGRPVISDGRAGNPHVLRPAPQAVPQA